MNNNITTLDTIATSATKIAVTKIKENVAPLPLEFNANKHLKLAELDDFYKQFPLIDQSYQSQLYFDKKYNVQLPKFATVDVTNYNGEVGGWGSSSDEAGDGSSFAFNKILRDCAKNISIEKNNKTFRGLYNKLEKAIGEFPAVLMTPSAIGISTVVIGISKGWTGEQLVAAGFISFVASLALEGLLCGVVFSDYFSKIVNTTIKFKFQGEIPEKTRAIYHQHKNKFDNICLICDAQNQWAVNSKEIPKPNKDPLLVGTTSVKGEKLMFLLDQFDLTFDERYISEEFSTKIDET